MGDAGGVLSSLGYKSMRCKLKKTSVVHNGMSVMLFLVACEKRGPNGKKIWLGNFAGLAKAAHAFDLVAEVFEWPERHYGRSELLLSKAAELRKDLGDGYSLDKHADRKKISLHANEYANLFPCSDSKRTLLAMFDLLAADRSVGPQCYIQVEEPWLPGNSSSPQYYPYDLLPPIAIPGTRAQTFNMRTSNKQTSKQAFKNTSSKFDQRYVFNRKEGPTSGVIGTRDVQIEMDVEPDRLSCIIVNDPGDQKNSSGMPYFHQQWTWCTRRTKSDLNQRRWDPPRVPYAKAPITTFNETKFVTGPKDCRPFSFLNYLVYHNINNLSLRAKAGYAACEWKGTSLERYEFIEPNKEGV
ncbi:hypothetical protein L7F22_045102 [Adiantum nelumboides]|nr:hypothetical protein [Adiantum nelumboides]